MRAPCLLLLLFVGGSFAQTQTLTREEQSNKLKLQESLLLLAERSASLQSTKEELDAIKMLFDEGFISLQKYNQTRNRYEQARLNFEQAEIGLEQVKLDLLKNATHITVREARKYKTADNRTMVEIVLENASATRNALLVDDALSEDEVRTLLKVENIYVSLRNGPIVGEPYEVRVPSLDVGASRSLHFRLLSDVESVYVQLNYLDIEDSISLLLQKGSDQDLPNINSAQFAQEGALEQSVSFALTLQWLSDEEHNFALSVIGLPRRIDYAFYNGNAKVNQVKFDQNTSRVHLRLQLQLPEKIDANFIDQTRTFYALITQPNQYARINALRTRFADEPVPEQEIAALESQYVKLELTPKGLGKLEIQTANRYQEIDIGEKSRVRIEIVNRGTAAVQNIKIILDLPYEWQESVTPLLVKLLEPGERAAIDIIAHSPEIVAAGDYELGIKARGQVGTEDVESTEKNITISVVASSNIAGNALLIALLVVMVIGIGISSVRLSRR
ncbi:MAG: hypothetical protein ACI906_000160 [Candidatus Latescibacterota bacterium]|jgi:hypothetical protein